MGALALSLRCAWAAPVVSVDISPDSQKFTLGGGFTGTSADATGIRGVSLAIQKKGAPDFYLNWNNMLWNQALPQFSTTTITPYMGTAVQWGLAFADANLATDTTYFVLVRSTNPAANIGVAETTFTFKPVPPPPPDGEGTIDLSSSSAVGCQLITATITFTVGASGIKAGGKIALRIPNGWTLPGGWANVLRPLPALPPPGTFYVEAPGGPGLYNLALNPTQSGDSILGENWVLYTPLLDLGPGQKVYLTYTGFPPGGALGLAPHTFRVMSQARPASRLVSVAVSPAIASFGGNAPSRLGFMPKDPMSLGPLQTSATMQIVLTDECGTSTVTATAIVPWLNAGRSGELDGNATFYASGGGPINVVTINAWTGVSNPFYFRTATRTAEGYEFLTASMTVAAGKTWASRFVTLLASSVTLSGVSVDTGTLTGAVTATMTGNGFASPAFVNFTLSPSDVRWEVIISTDNVNWFPEVFHQPGAGEPGRTVSWNWVNDRVYPPMAVPPGVYYVKVLVEGGLAVDATRRLYVSQSPSIYGSLGAGGRGALVQASGPGANSGNVAVATDTAGNFRIYGLESGHAYNVTATTQVKTAAGQFMTLTVSSLNATATTAGTDIGAMTFPAPGYLRVSAAINPEAPSEAWGRVRAIKTDYSHESVGALHFSTGSASSDDGGQEFGALPSTWTVMGVPPGVYDLDIGLFHLGLSTRVTGVTVTGGSQTDVSVSLQKKANVYGWAVLPGTTTFGAWVSVQGTKLGDRYPSAFGGAFIGPQAAPGLVYPSSATFTVFGLEPGSWTITAKAPGYITASSAVLVTTAADIGNLFGAPASRFNLFLSTAGVIDGMIVVGGDTRFVPGAPDDPPFAFSVFVDAVNPATFSRAMARVSLARRADVTSSTFTLAGVEDGSWVLSSRMKGFTEGRQTAAVANGRGAASLSMGAYDSRLVMTVRLPYPPYAQPDYRKVSAIILGPDIAPSMRGDLVEGSSMVFRDTYATWYSSAMIPGSYIIEAVHGPSGMVRRLEVPLADKSTTYATLDFTGSTFSVSGRVSLAGNVVFSSATFSVSVSSVAGLVANAPATSYCLLGSAQPVGVSAAHMELLPIDMRTGQYYTGPLTYAPASVGPPACGQVAMPPGVGYQSPNPFRAQVAALAADGTFSFASVPAGTYILRNNGELDLNTRNGDELPQIRQVVNVNANVALAPLKLESGASVSGTVYLPEQMVVSRAVGLELLDGLGNRLRWQTVGFNNSNTASYVFERLANGNYAIAVHDLDLPKAFGATTLTVKVQGMNLAGQDIRLKRTGVIKGKIALQSRLPDGTTGPLMLVSNNNARLLPAGFTVEAKANPWFQGGRRPALGRNCGPNGCSIMLDGSDQFTIEDLLPGTYDVRMVAYNTPEAMRDGAMSVVPRVLPAVKVAEGRLSDVGTVNILAGIELRGKVTDSASGAPLANVTLEARPSKREGGREPEGFAWTRTDMGGNYVLYGLSPLVRYYDVVAGVRPRMEVKGNYTPPYEQQISRGVDLSSSAALDFTLAYAPYSVKGRVVAPAGGPTLKVAFDTGQAVPGARLFLQKKGVIPTENPIADIVAYTDSDGFFEIGSLAAGTYRLVATAMGYGSKTAGPVIGTSSADLGVLTMSQGAGMSGSIRKPDGSNPSQDEVQSLVAANADMSELLVGTLVSDANTKTVTEYTLSGFQPGVRYALMMVDRRENVIAPEEASYLVFSSSSEERGLDLVYRMPKPTVFAKARRAGTKFKVEFSMTHPLRQKKTGDDAYETILGTYSAKGTLAEFELSEDRSKLSAVYAPDVTESSFTLMLNGWSSVPDPGSTSSTDPEFRLQTVATFYAGIDGMHQSQVSNLWGGNLLVEGDLGRLNIPSGAFAVASSSSVEVSLKISSETLARMGVAGVGGAGARGMRFASSAYPAELMRAMAAVPPTMSPLSAFYNIMLPLGIQTALSKPVQMTVSYSSGTDPRSLNLYWYNPMSNTYVLQQDVTGSDPVIDEVNRTITLNINHFSTFVLFDTAVNVITGDVFSGSGIEAFCFPNPFDLETKTVSLIHPASNHVVRGTMMRFTLGADVSGAGSVKIFSVRGEKVRTIDLGNLTGGQYYYQAWDGRNDSGRDVASGVYVGQIKVGSKVKSFKMALIK
ncbi:MAG: hypothetical protein HY927_05760 [Elusimicrobia bacterium]|nr:hypothetical protein [Elusimicrobiota bacterium]